MRKQLSTQMNFRNQEIISQYHKHRKTQVELGKQFGMTHQNVSHILKELGGIQPKRSGGKAQKHKDYILANPDKSNRDLARELDISIGSVYSIRKFNPALRWRGMYHGHILKQVVETESAVIGRLFIYGVACHYDFNSSGDHALLTEHGDRILVAVSQPHDLPGVMGLNNKYAVHRGRNLDFYICCELERREFFVIPAHLIPPKQTWIYITWPLALERKDSWGRFFEMWELLQGIVEN